MCIRDSQDTWSDPGHIVQLVHRLEGPVRLSVVYNVLGPLLPNAGQAPQIILVRGIEIDLLPGQKAVRPPPKEEDPFSVSWGSSRSFRAAVT